LVFNQTCMIHVLLGTKLSQSQTYTQDGIRIPVTSILMGPNWVTKIEDIQTRKTVQLGFGDSKHISKAESGHLKKAGLDKKLRFLRSFSLRNIGNISDSGDLTLGSEIKVDMVFKVGDLIRVTGTSKGKGFAGVVKRHNFRGGPRTHGQSDRERAPGSIGQTTTPGRVYKGKRMAGRMGSDRVTVRNLTVVSINPQTQVMTVKGVVPGGKNGLLIVQKEPEKIVAKKL
jgi:large subunit ribosomal protein L3